jgi:chemotaxis protein MotA
VSTKRSRLDFTSVLGLPVGLGLILLGQAIEGGSARSVLQFTAALIVFGGTLGAVLFSFSLQDILRAGASVKKLFLWDGEAPVDTVRSVLKYATQARTSGVLSLEDELPGVADPFLRKGLTMVVDGANPLVLRDMLETEIESREEFDEIPAKVFESAGGYAPTIGILGAVLGLIQIMQHLSDPSKLGEGIAVAFVATIYGVGSANLIFLPASNKLKLKARHETKRRELLLEAVLGIQEGLNPKIIQQKLESMDTQAESTDEKRRAA